MRREAVIALALALGCKNEAASSAPIAGRSWKTPPLPPPDSGPIAKHLPRVVHRGGAFLRNPRIVTITFAGEDPALATRLEQFGDTITRSDWWRQVVDAYCLSPTDCIGEAKPGPHVRLGTKLAPTMRDVDVSELLAREANAGRFGAISPDTLLLAYLPKGTALSDLYTPHYCDGGPRAFHRSLAVDDKKPEDRIAFAVMARCGDEAELTATASHELLEATTNPDPSQRGFAFERSSKNLGFMIAGTEAVDPCGLITQDGHWTVSGGFAVQRAWSNREASLGHDPCVPSRPNRPYLALVPRQATVRITKEGDSASVVLDAAADRSVPKWAASAIDLSGYQEHAEYLDLALDKTTVGAGETVNLTVTLKKKPPTEVIVAGAVSTLGPIAHLWPIAVNTR